MSLGGIDPNSADLTDLRDTRFIGMAASIATTIKGQDVIPDARALEAIASDQLDVSPYAFPEVIRLLEDMGWVGAVETKGSRVVKFSESIPLHSDIYGLLGDAWRNRQPDEFEQSFVSGVNRLAMGPVAEEQFADAVGIDRKDSAKLLKLAHAADMAKTIVTSDGRVVYSPYYFFENADQLGNILETHGTQQFQDELHRVRNYQGLPTNAETPALNDAINRGIIIAPSVLAPDQSQKTFAFLPYTIDRAFYTIKKKILDKALAIVSCVRCGENFGGYNAIRNPVSILDKLLDVNTNFTLKPHSSHQRQYELLFRMQIVDFIPSGNWVSPKLISTADNIEAVNLARDLILSGEAVSNRDSSADDARDALMNRARYQTPIETVRSKRDKHVLDGPSYTKLFRAAFGYTAL